MFEILSSPFVIRAIIAIILISVVSAFAGSFSVFRQSTFLIAGVAHAALGGAAFGILLALYSIVPFMDPLTGALIFAVLTGVFVGYVTQKGPREKIDIAIGGAFAMSMSLAVIFVSMIREYATVAWGLLLGDILLLSNTDILYLLVMSIVITFVSILLFREFLFISFDMETASAYGVRVNLYNMIMLVIISIAVVVVLKGVGAILVYALLTIPPAAANEIADSPSQVVTYAFAISLFSGFVGLAISFFADVAPSGITGLVVTIIYVITVILRHGST